MNRTHYTSLISVFSPQMNVKDEIG